MGIDPDEVHLEMIEALVPDVVEGHVHQVDALREQGRVNFPRSSPQLRPPTST
jgi:hypothetical protein